MLFRRRNVWLPTPLGWLVLALVAAVPVIVWWFGAERFLAVTDRQPADVLVVEGWIGLDGFRAVKQEFESGGYRHVVTAGGRHYNRWGDEHWNYAEEAGKVLVRMGVPADRIIVARADDNGNQRTHASAVAVRRELAALKLQPAAVNVITIGAHARRSRLIFARVLKPVEVGVISWTPPEYDRAEPWWRSSDRSEEIVKETAGYPFELLFWSGRWFTNAEP